MDINPISSCGKNLLWEQPWTMFNINNDDTAPVDDQINMPNLKMKIINNSSIQNIKVNKDKQNILRYLMLKQVRSLPY